MQQEAKRFETKDGDGGGGAPTDFASFMAWASGSTRRQICGIRWKQNKTRSRALKLWVVWAPCFVQGYLSPARMAELDPLLWSISRPVQKLRHFLPSLLTVAFCIKMLSFNDPWRGARMNGIRLSPLIFSFRADSIQHMPVIRARSRLNATLKSKNFLSGVSYRSDNSINLSLLCIPKKAQRFR